MGRKKKMYIITMRIIVSIQTIYSCILQSATRIFNTHLGCLMSWKLEGNYLYYNLKIPLPSLAFLPFPLKIMHFTLWVKPSLYHPTCCPILCSVIQDSHHFSSFFYRHSRSVLTCSSGLRTSWYFRGIRCSASTLLPYCFQMLTR